MANNLKRCNNCWRKFSVSDSSRLYSFETVEIVGNVASKRRLRLVNCIGAAEDDDDAADAERGGDDGVANVPSFLCWVLN